MKKRNGRSRERQSDISFERDRHDRSVTGYHERELEKEKKHKDSDLGYSTRMGTMKITDMLKRSEIGDEDSLKKAGAMAFGLGTSVSLYPTLFSKGIAESPVLLRLANSLCRKKLSPGLIDTETLVGNAKPYLDFFSSIIISEVEGIMKDQIKSSLDSDEKAKMKSILFGKGNSAIYFNNNPDGHRDQENETAVMAIAALTPQAREFRLRCQVTYKNVWCCHVFALLSEDCVKQLKRQHEIVASNRDERDMVIKETIEDSIWVKIFDGTFWSIHGEEGQISFILSQCNQGGRQHVAMKDTIAALYREDGTSVATWAAQTIAFFARFCDNFGHLVQFSPKLVLLEIFGQFTKEEMDKMQLNSQSETLQGIIDGKGGINEWASSLRKKATEGLFDTQKKFIQKYASIPNDMALAVSKEKFASKKRSKKEKKKQGTSSDTTNQKQKRRRNRESKSEDAPPPGHADSDRNADGTSKRRKKTPPKKKKSSYDGKGEKTLMFAFVQDNLTGPQRDKAAKLLTDRKKAGKDTCNACGEGGHMSTECKNVTKGLVLKPVTRNGEGKWVVKPKVRFSENALTTTGWNYDSDEEDGDLKTWETEFTGVLPDEPLRQE